MTGRPFLTITLGVLGAVAALHTTNLQADVVAFPSKGQSQEQQMNDKAYCSQWATKQTGVSPEDMATASAQSQAPGQAPPPGGPLGARRKLKQQEQAQQQQQKQQQAAQGQMKDALSKYDQAQKVCLEGKGYSVN